MIVVDSSAVLEAIAGRPVDADLGARLRGARDLHAPHLIDVEVLNALRRLVGGGELTEDRALDALDDFRDLAINRYPHPPLASRVWELRHTLTAYDACFVALAEALEMPLVTCDAALATVPGARVELFPPTRPNPRTARKTGRRPGGRARSG